MSEFTKEEYQTAEKIYKEYYDEPKLELHRYPDWIEDRAKPVDPTYEAFKAWRSVLGVLTEKTMYKSLRSDVFKDELNQNAGLNDAIREFVERPKHTSYNTAYIISVLEEVKTKLEDK